MIIMNQFMCDYIQTLDSKHLESYNASFLKWASFDLSESFALCLYIQ